MKISKIHISLITLSVMILFCFSAPLSGASSPDLIVSGLTISPQDPAPGTEVEISARITNTGNQDSGRFYVALYLNGDRIDNQHIPLGLDSGETKSINFTWTAVAGHHQIRIKADDPFDKVNESNESNNYAQRKVEAFQQIKGTKASRLKIAIARFEDRSNSGFANVSQGISDILAQKLVNRGFTVVERAELESVIREQQLNPAKEDQLARAGQIAGADVLLIGSVTNIDITKTTISLGFISVSGASVDVKLTYRLVSTYTGEILEASQLTAEAEGQTDFSFQIGEMINSISQVRSNVCAGGLVTDKSTYYKDDVINVGYLDPSPPTSYTIEFFGPGGSVGPSIWSQMKQSSIGEPCLVWSWNSSTALPPGNYRVHLYRWNNLSSPIAISNFQVSPNVAPPSWTEEITVGSQQFSESIVGEAVTTALTRLTGEIGSKLSEIAPKLLKQRKKYSSDQDQDQQNNQLSCRIVSIEQDNTVILGGINGNCGKEDGVSIDDIFYLFTAKTVTDPNTGEIIEIIPQQDSPKGKVIITKVYNKVCKGQLISDFNVEVGDLAIKKP